jgi:uncharacterized membrane protein
MSDLSTLVLVLATASTGMSAGVFATYAIALMPGLRATDDRTFVTSFQSIDRAIINPLWLGGGFLGALVLTAAAAALHLGTSSRPIFVWTAAAFVLHAAVVLITLLVNVPLNDAIKAAGNAPAIDVAAVRAAFSEQRWVTWNHVRVVLDAAALLTLCCALIAHGRSSG